MGFGRCASIFIGLFALTSCVAPGKPYSYLDLKFISGTSVTPGLPAENQPATIAFTVFNTDLKPLSNVSWRAYETIAPALPPAVPPATPAFASGGPLTLAAYEQRTVTFPTGGRPAGTYTYTIFLDPDNLIGEREEGNNARSVSLLVADLDVAFDVLAPPSVDAIPLTGDLTLRFAVTNTNNVGVAAPVATSVGYQIYLDDGASPPVTAAIVPTSANQPSPVVVPANTTSSQIVVTVPRPTPGTHTYTIVLTSSIAEWSTTDNTTMVITPTVN
jgi:hypothetical protein